MSRTFFTFLCFFFSDNLVFVQMLKSGMWITQTCTVDQLSTAVSLVGGDAKETVEKILELDSQSLAKKCSIPLDVAERIIHKLTL